MQGALQAAHAREHSLSGEIFAATRAKENLQAKVEAGTAREVELRTLLRDQEHCLKVAESLQDTLGRQLQSERADADVSHETQVFMPF